MPSTHNDALQIFTDGSFNARDRTGAWAFVIFDGDHRIHVERGTSTGQSNNSFEVMAVFRALSWLDMAGLQRVATVWTDSAHVIEGVDRWRMIWRGNGWKRIDPNPRARRRKIPDAALWQGLDSLIERNGHVKIAWCKAHAGVIGNEEADALAAGRTQVIAG